VSPRTKKAPKLPPLTLAQQVRKAELEVPKLVGFTISRQFTSPTVITDAFVEHVAKHTFSKNVTLVHGDHAIDRWVLSLVSFYLPDARVEAYPANWEREGRSAGPQRNQRMVDRVKDDPIEWKLWLAFVTPDSRGATGCARMAETAGLRTIRYTP
jgi:hypothetical protein